MDVYKISPPNITSLKNNEVFVFGSNQQGIHGAGAAKIARDKFDAKLGVGSGPTGRCYAIPTKVTPSEKMKLTDIKNYVDEFIGFAKGYPDLTFMVTAIGCGYAGFTPRDIAPLFRGATREENIYLPESFWDILNG